MSHVLRYPLNQQFLKMVNDDHEWNILTDHRLRILAFIRGARDHIDEEDTRKMYRKLSDRNPRSFSTKTVRVYDLHTHPKTPDPAPSFNDLRGFILQNGFRMGSVLVDGFGVVARKGIVIVKIPDTENRIDESIEKPQKYVDNTREYIKQRLGVKTWQQAIKVAKDIPEEREHNIVHDAHKRGFNALAKESQNLKVKRIHRKLGVRRPRRR